MSNTYDPNNSVQPTLTFDPFPEAPAPELVQAQQTQAPVKEEPKPQKEEYIIKNIVKALEESIECLIKVKNKFHYLGYFEDERAIGIKIEFLKILNSTVIKKLSHRKDNAN